MRKFKKRTFELLSDLELPALLQDATLEECVFAACNFGQTATSPDDRRVVRNVSLLGCTATGSALGPIVADSILVAGLKTHGVALIYGAAFRHVVFTGQCGRLLLNLPRPGGREKVFRRANAEFYSAVDWAIDISKANFAELEIRGVPADLIRRDPETQFVARRQTIMRTEGIWRTIDLDGTPWATSLHNLLEWGLEDQVLVAPRRSKNFSRWLTGLRTLHKAGILES
jgi:hypothetical protein